MENKTSICSELIKAIALDVGLDLNACTLIVEYRGKSHGVQDNFNGQFTHRGSALVVQVNPWANTSTLAHEMRHAYQSHVLGKASFIALYNIEMECEGYEGNVLEIDAREAGNRWKV